MRTGKKLTWRMAGFFLVLALANHPDVGRISRRDLGSLLLFAVPALMMIFADGAGAVADPASAARGRPLADD